MSRSAWLPGKRMLVLPTLVLSARSNDPSLCRLVGKAGCDNVLRIQTGVGSVLNQSHLKADLKPVLFPTVDPLHGAGRIARRCTPPGELIWQATSRRRKRRRQASGFSQQADPGTIPPRSDGLSAWPFIYQIFRLTMPLLKALLLRGTGGRKRGCQRHWLQSWPTHATAERKLAEALAASRIQYYGVDQSGPWYWK
jgi:hypothetical protein